MSNLWDRRTRGTLLSEKEAVHTAYTRATPLAGPSGVFLQTPYLPEVQNMKAAIVVMSDPEANNDEALGRVFNALGVAYDFKNHGDEVTLVFLGAREALI
jgi:hypothetical protein